MQVGEKGGTNDPSVGEEGGGTLMLLLAERETIVFLI